MEYRQLGNTDLKVSAIGFGTWPIGGTHYGPVDEEQSIRAIERAVEVGITVFDSAPTYGRGHAEELLGKVLAPHRKDVVLVTKCGMTWDPNEPALGGPSQRDSSQAQILRSVEDSLRRLRTDVIDVYLVHWPDPNVPLDETMRTMEDLRQSGKVRYIGVSNFRVDHMRECMRYATLNANQVSYHLFDQRQAPDVFPFCQQNGIGVIAFGSLAHGLLTGTFSTNTSFVDWDWRSKGTVFGQKLFNPGNFEKNVKVVDNLKEVAQDLNVSLPSLALNWSLRHPAISVALVGTRTPEEVDANLEALGWKIPQEAMERIDHIMEGAAGTTCILP